MTSSAFRLFAAVFVVLAVATLSLAGPQSSADSNKKPKMPKNSDVEDIGSRNINKGNILPTMSLEKEIAIGRQLADQVRQQSRFVDDPVVNEYVNRLEQNIVRNSDAKVPFTIKIIDSEEINAFSLPGGFVFVNSGLILEASNEAELAGVLAHETAHVAARHGAEAASKQTAAGLASIPLILLGGPAGVGARQAAEIGVPLTFLKFSRKQEAEADYLGVQYMYKSGYDPGAMLTFFEKLQAKEKAKSRAVSSLFSDHPPTPERAAAVKKEIETILPAREQYLVTSSEFDQIRARLESLENQKQEDSKRPDARGGSSRRRPANTSSGSQGTRTGPEDPSAQSPSQASPEPDDRPTLKRND